MDSISTKYRKPRRSRSRQGRHLASVRNSTIHDQPADPATAATTPDPGVPNLPDEPAVTPKSSRSEEKLSRFTTTINTSENEYFIVDSAFLIQLVNNFKCDMCKQKTIDIGVQDRKGFAVKFSVQCTVCEHVQCELYSSNRIVDSESSRPGFHINRRMTTAFLDIGCGHASMSRFCSAIGMKVMDITSFYGHVNKMKQETEKLMAKTLEESRKAVREAHYAVDPSLEDEPQLDLTVSVDGSWHRRGHISMYGFVAAIDVLTALVVDFVVLSKFCLMCSIAASQYGQESEEYAEWKEKHLENSECSINFTDSSGNMEAAGAVILFKRSVQEANMRYVAFLADGDAKTLSQLNKEQPYGSTVVIEKEECVNHVSKRMGTALRNLVQDQKKKGITLGGRGEGTLTDNSIKVLQGYYHKAIVSNAPDVPKMKAAVLASLYHCASTDKAPKHTYCPKGKESWCFYNKRVAQRKNKGKHASMPIKLNKKVFDTLLPVYKRLSSDELLTRCAKGQTQNANEALHSVIWKKVPKHIFVSKARLEYGITLGVAENNMGCEAFLGMRAEIQNEPVPEVSLAVARRLDNRRKAQSAHQEDPATKKARLLKKHKNKNKKTSTLYAAGAGD